MSAGDGDWTAVFSGTANRLAATGAAAGGAGASLDGSNCHGVSGEAGAKSRVSLQAPSNAHPARALRRNLVLRFIRTVHRNIALLLFPANEVVKKSGGRTNSPSSRKWSPRSKRPAGRAGHALLFHLFYQVEIRHRQLRQRQFPAPRSGADARIDMAPLWQLYDCCNRNTGASQPGLPTKGHSGCTI